MVGSYSTGRALGFRLRRGGLGTSLNVTRRTAGGAYPACLSASRSVLSKRDNIPVQSSDERRRLRDTASTCESNWIRAVPDTKIGIQLRILTSSDHPDGKGSNFEVLSRYAIPSLLPLPPPTHSGELGFPDIPHSCLPFGLRCFALDHVFASLVVRFHQNSLDHYPDL